MIAPSSSFTPLATFSRPGKVRQVLYNIKDSPFNAKGDGVTDDTAAIQAAIDAVLSAGTGKVYAPHGTYNISSALTATLSGQSLIIEGEGSGTIFANVSTAGAATTGDNTIQVTGSATIGAEYFAARNFSLTGSSVVGMGLRVVSVYAGEVSNIFASGFTNTNGTGFGGGSWGVGIYLRVGIGFQIIGPICRGNYYAGMQLDGSSNANAIIGGWFYSNTLCNVRVSNGANQCSFYSSIFEGCTGGNGLQINGTTGGIRCYGCWFENNKRGVYAATSAANIHLNNCWFEAKASGGDYDVYMDTGSSKLQMRGCSATTSGANTGAIFIAAAVTGNLLDGNQNFAVTNNGTIDYQQSAGVITLAQGAVGAPSVGFKGATNYGIFFDPSWGMVLTHNGSGLLGTRSGALVTGSNTVLSWTGAGYTGTIDVGLSRSNTNILAVGTGAAGDNSGSLTLTNITHADGGNIILGTTTGTKIGTAGGASGQKLGFYNATPVVQPLLATGAAHTVDDVITVLQNLGLVRQT